MNKTTLTKNKAYDIAKQAEPFLRSVVEDWEHDEPMTVSNIYKEILADPEGFRDFINDLVIERDLSWGEIAIANDILSALCEATGEEFETITAWELEYDGKDYGQIKFGGIKKGEA